MDHNVNFPDVAKIKVHFRKNKDRYKFFGIGAVAGITLVIMRGRCADFLRSSDTAATTVFARPLFLFSNHNKIINVVAVIEREGRGHPGYSVMCKETGDFFFSQNGAAAWAGVSDANMSLHVRGKLPDVDGWHFERVPAIPAVVPTAA